MHGSHCLRKTLAVSKAQKAAGYLRTLALADEEDNEEKSQKQAA
jgi:hypothetical protein